MKEPARYACINLALPNFPQANDPAWDQAGAVDLKDVVSAERPFLHTELRILRDDAQEALFLRFVAEDDQVLATYRLHDETLYKQDVFELFVADGKGLASYKEIQVSPYDLHFTGSISFDKDGSRSLNMDWDIPGFISKTRHHRERHQTVSVWKLPYAAFDIHPAPGTSWRFNAFRVDQSPRGESLQAWQPTGLANFHVPERFGYLDFVR